MKTLAVLKIVSVITLVGTISACSSTPEKSTDTPTLGAAVQAPAPQEVEVARSPNLTLDNVLFDFEAFNLRPSARATVQQAARYLNSNPGRTVLIEGHTDHTGDARYNQMLSVQRSESIKNALMSMGISESRIRARGMGESKPIASNNTFAGRQANRRVEVIFVGS